MAINYVKSDKPLGEVLNKDQKQNLCMKKSAGHWLHEFTTGYAHNEIIKHFGI